MSIRKKVIIISTFVAFCVATYIVVNYDNKVIVDTKLEVINEDGTVDIVSSTHSKGDNDELSKKDRDKQAQVETLLIQEDYIDEAHLSYTVDPSDDSKLCFTLILDGFDLQENINTILLIITSNIENINLENGSILDTDGNIIFIGE